VVPISLLLLIVSPGDICYLLEFMPFIYAFRVYVVLTVTCGPPDSGPMAGWDNKLTGLIQPGYCQSRTQ
ncbi:MAG: hypothetical protein ACKOB4_18360, partial [Acidobacteriota bacterium]